MVDSPGTTEPSPHTIRELPSGSGSRGPSQPSKSKLFQLIETRPSARTADRRFRGLGESPADDSDREIWIRQSKRHWIRSLVKSRLIRAPSRGIGYPGTLIRDVEREGIGAGERVESRYREGSPMARAYGARLAWAGLVRCIRPRAPIHPACHQASSIVRLSSGRPPAKCLIIRTRRQQVLRDSFGFPDI